MKVEYAAVKSLVHHDEFWWDETQQMAMADIILWYVDIFHNIRNCLNVV